MGQLAYWSGLCWPKPGWTVMKRWKDRHHSYQCEIFIEESELVALEAREGLSDVAADPGKVRFVAVECQHLLVRHDPRPVPFKVGELQKISA